MTSDSNEDHLINHREVAKILRVHPGSVHRYVSNGLIPEDAFIRLPSGARQTGNTPNGRGNMLRFWHSKILKVQEEASRKGNLGIGQEEGKK